VATGGLGERKGFGEKKGEPFRPKYCKLQLKGRREGPKRVNWGRRNMFKIKRGIEKGMASAPGQSDTAENEGTGADRKVPREGEEDNDGKVAGTWTPKPGNEVWHFRQE